LRRGGGEKCERFRKRTERGGGENMRFTPSSNMNKIRKRGAIFYLIFTTPYVSVRFILLVLLSKNMDSPRSVTNSFPSGGSEN